MAQEINLLILPGDGIGAEAMTQVRRVVDWIGTNRNITFNIEEDLVGGCAEEVVGALGLLRLGAAQECGVRGGVRAGIGVGQLQVADHVHVLTNLRQRLEDVGQIVERLALGRPASVVAAHRHEDVAETLHRFAGRPSRRRRFRVSGWSLVSLSYLRSWHYYLLWCNRPRCPRSPVCACCRAGIDREDGRVQLEPVYVHYGDVLECRACDQVCDFSASRLNRISRLPSSQKFRVAAL